MYLSSIAATAIPGGLAALSQDFLTAGIVLVGVMTLAYLAYTIGTARLAKKIAVERAASRIYQTRALLDWLHELQTEFAQMS